MNTHFEKTQKNKSQSAVNSVSQKKNNSNSTFNFVNNRTEAVAQRKLQEVADNKSKQIAQFQQTSSNNVQIQTVQKKENKTGLPDNLKTGIENLSGYSMDDVKVHYNSNKPAQLQAHAYAQGTDIHIGAGQEKHLPHEAWHVVQQKQGRVKPTMQLKGKVSINDDTILEKEADGMGAAALQMKSQEVNTNNLALSEIASGGSTPIQRLSIQKEFNKTEERGLKEAPPFQLATVQFEGNYDLNLYKVHVLDYLERTSDSSIPVIELRAYDSAFPESIDQYLEEAAKIIQSWWGEERPFILRYKTLRDEAMEPSMKEDGLGEIETQGIIKSLEELALTDEKLPSFLQHNPELKKPKDEMEKGNMMIPAPEFHDLLLLESEELNRIWKGHSKEKYSLHVRQMAKLILEDRLKSVEKKDVEKEEVPFIVPKLTRSNSMVMPDTLTITNLVVGEEEMTRIVVAEAVKSAFKKGVTQVLLTVEHEGYSKSKYGRISPQIENLREQGFRVDTIESIGDGKGKKAQQSGIKKEEPTERTPARSILKITPETRKKLPSDVSETIEKNQWVKEYTKWYCHMVKDDQYEALDLMSISGAQFLREMKGYV